MTATVTENLPQPHIVGVAVRCGEGLALLEGEVDVAQDLTLGPDGGLFDLQWDDPVDLDGHGTATAGLVVGGADGGTSYGMAPGATLIAARIFDDRGATAATTGDTAASASTVPHGSTTRLWP